MPEAPQTTVDTAGITRTPQGEITSPKEPSKEQTTETTTSIETKPEVKATELSKEGEKEKSLLGKAKEGEEKEEAKSGAPEKYEDFKAPEGYELDKETIAKAAPLFKELGLSQERAQKLVDLYATLSAEAAEAPTKFWEAKQTEWRKEVITDKDVGNGVDGVKKDVLTSISKAIDALPGGGKDFREAMEYTGAGNHLPFIKAMAHWARFVTEGSHVPGAGPSKFGQAAPGKPLGKGAGAVYPHLPSAAGG